MRVFVLFLVCSWLVRPAEGQELADLYRNARFNVQAQAHLEATGMRADPAAPQHIPSRSDTLLQWLMVMRAGSASTTYSGEPFAIDEWQLVRRLERGWFEKRYASTLWAYLGTESLMPIDTTLTRDLRARMEAYFGPPTQTITEVLGPGSGKSARDRYIQFEYWFVLNDTIPLVVMDVNGPLERGLIVSSDYRYRDILLRIRESFMEEFLRSDRRAPYIDYYYNPIESSWYYAGFDGLRYYLERTKQPNFALGRPWLNALSRSD
ncbi:MAG: hypothetical protein R2834_15295 [Rhodothermales bacterium]